MTYRHAAWSPAAKAKIGVRIGRVVNKYKAAKHFELTVEDRRFELKTLEDGSPVHSFRTLLEDLATVVRNTCVTRSAKTVSPALQMVTTPTDTRHRALQLLQQITV